MTPVILRNKNEKEFVEYLAEPAYRQQLLEMFNFIDKENKKNEATNN